MTHPPPESQTCGYPENSCAIRGRPVVDHVQHPSLFRPVNTRPVAFIDAAQTADWRLTAFRSTPMGSTSSSITSPSSRNRPVSRPQQFPTVPEPKNSPA